MSALGQMFSSFGASLPVVGGAFQGLANYQAQKQDFENQSALANMQAKNQKELMREQAKINREMLRTSALDTVSGLKAAGLNPSLLSDGKFSPVSTPAPAAPLPHSNGVSSVDAAALQQSAAQTNLANAQADKIKAETDEIKSSDSAIDNALKDVIGDAAWNNIDPAVQSFAKTLLASSEHFKLGTVEGLNKFMDYMTNDRDSLVHRLETEFKQRLWDARLSGDLPELQTGKEITEFEIASQKLINDSLETLLKTADVGRQENVGELIKAQLQKTLADARKTHDTDLIALLEDGDKFDAFIKIFEGVLSAVSAYGLVKAGGKLLTSGAQKVLGKATEKTAAKTAEKVAEKVPLKNSDVVRPVVRGAPKKVEASFADWLEYDANEPALIRAFGKRNAENMFRYYNETRKQGDTFGKYLVEHGILLHPNKSPKISH